MSRYPDRGMVLELSGLRVACREVAEPDVGAACDWANPVMFPEIVVAGGMVGHD